MIKSFISFLWKNFVGGRAKLTEIADVYLKHIDFQDKQLEEQRKIIAVYKEKHPENGKELDEWLAREEELHKKIIKLIQENRDLKEHIIFLEADLKALKKKHRSMYE